MRYCPNQNLSNYFGRALIFEQGGLFCVSPHRTLQLQLASETNLPLVPEFTPGLLLVPIFQQGLSPVGLASKTTTICEPSFWGVKTLEAAQFVWTKAGIRYFEQTWTWWRAWRRSRCWPASGASSGSSPSSSQVTFRLSREDKSVWGSFMFNLFADGRVYNADAELILNSQNHVKWAGF